MNVNSDGRGESHRELIGTLKYAGWIGLIVIIIVCIAIILGK